MRLPFVRRSHHESEVARQRDRTAELRRQVDRAKSSAQKHKSVAERLRAELGTARHHAKCGQHVVEQVRGHRDLRALLAMKLSGQGIEIGALHNPLPVLPGVVVRYVDLRTREENAAKFPHLPAQDIVETSLVCDGQTLSAVPDESQDFVISNHMLEHVVNPLGALKTFLRVLKPQGRLFLSLPDKRFTFDFKRPATPWEHVLHDYEAGREVEERHVYEEYRHCVDPTLDPDEAVATRQEIHHHAWTQGEILEFFVNARRVLGWPLEVELFAKQGCEVMLVLQKFDPPHEDHAKFARPAETQSAEAVETVS